jgi:PBP1b-binding outer membrane lipoprotein LpoB
VFHFRRIIAVAAIAFFWAGCANAAPMSYNGTWKSEGSPQFIAHIKGDRIQVILKSSDSSDLYWQGTFTSNSTKIVSKADTKALGDSLLGSTEKTKVFVYKDGKFRFTFSALGESRVVLLTK